MARKIKLLGYTIFEILIVITIIGILSAIVLREVLSYIAEARLREAVNQFVSDLEYTKNMAQITDVPWGVRACLNTGIYKIFIDHDGNCRDAEDNCISVSNDSVSVCINAFNTYCSSSDDCPSAASGSCRKRTILKELPLGISFTGNSEFYIVFDRKGYPFNTSCGLGTSSITISNQFDKKFVIKISSVGRIRLETQ